MYVTMPHWSYGASFIRGSLLQEGVEVRSPLLDMKIVEFGLGRPIAERFDGQTTKILLRQAMAGLLPPEILAPRTRRTGTTVGFSRRRMREAYPALVARIFEEPIRLSEVGIVDPVALRASADAYLAGRGDDYLRVNLFQAMKVEFWLRGLERRVVNQRSVATSTAPMEVSAA
jgi:asparagine synthase (glutamine-hydrolysing)